MTLIEFFMLIEAKDGKLRKHDELEDTSALTKRFLIVSQKPYVIRLLLRIVDDATTRYDCTNRKQKPNVCNTRFERIALCT